MRLVKGFDYEIVRMALAAGLRPRIVHWERIHLSLHDRTACRALLDAHGYRFAPDAGLDSLAALPF